MSDDVFVDLGRSHVRVVSAGVDITATGGGSALGVQGALDAARVVLAALPSARTPSRSWRLAVCAPGVVTDADAAQRLADALASGSGADRVLVMSDSAAWQAGAFAGADGAVVAVGTGAVTTARDGSTVLRLDGRGLLLGDIGGGAWIGLHALRAADRDPTGALHERAVARFGPPSAWPGLLGPDLAPVLAAFVPDVVALAEGADTAADDVLDAAARGLAHTIAPLPGRLPVCLVGGLAATLQPRLRAVVDREWSDPKGDAIDGLRLLLDDLGPFAAESFHGRAESDGTNEVDLLPTEAVAIDTADLDTWPTIRLVTRLIEGHRGAAEAVLAAAPALTDAVDLATRALGGSGRLVYVGAGTPGRLAVQDAAELTPTFGLDSARVPVLLAGGPEAGATAVEGAEDDVAAAANDVDALRVTPDDVVVGITASGRTPYVLGALERAAELGATTVGICNVVGSPLATAADVTVELRTGPEVIAGSTRLAAGTAQKIALNTLSTATMVRTGSTFGPWMVDMIASNEKLRRRAVRMVRDAAGVSEAAAMAALTEAGQSVQVALVMLLGRVDAHTARGRLTGSGSVRAAVGGNGS